MSITVNITREDFSYRGGGVELDCHPPHILNTLSS